MDNINLQLWENNRDSVVASPDPATTYTAMTAGTAMPTVTPLFIQQGLGPNGTAGTMVSDIDSGFLITKAVLLLSFS